MTLSSADVRLERDTISVGRFFSIDFQRTLRLPDDGREYPLPPGFGAFPLRAVAEFGDRVPASWREKGGFLLPMHRHEALWLSFSGAYYHPVAVRVEIGGVCALTGAREKTLTEDPQNYMVVPNQPWLDGIKAGEGTVRQFVAAPLGENVTVEAQMTGEETVGGIQLTIVEPKAGRFPDRIPESDHHRFEDGADFSDPSICFSKVCESAPMGLGAGGRMVQKIYPDEYGFETWDAESAVTVNIHLVDARDWLAITGEAPPRSPISVETYRAHGLPWFELADHAFDDLPVLPVLAGIKPIPFV
jgi:hypothetical protein